MLFILNERTRITLQAETVERIRRSANSYRIQCWCQDQFRALLEEVRVLNRL